MDRNSKSIEVKKEEFNAYLERYGVPTKINEVLGKLYDEANKNKISNPIEFIRKELGDKSISEENIDTELAAAKKKNNELKKQKEDLEKEYHNKKKK
jgi:hypothetical protein